MSIGKTTESIQSYWAIYTKTILNMTASVTTAEGDTAAKAIVDALNDTKTGLSLDLNITPKLAEVENDTIVTFLEQEVDFGKPLSSYAKNKSANPIRFIIDKNVVDGRHISMVLLFWK